MTDDNSMNSKLLNSLSVEKHVLCTLTGTESLIYTSLESMKSGDFNERIFGLESLYEKVIEQASTKEITMKYLPIIKELFECEKSNDVLIHLAKLCSKIGKRIIHYNNRNKQIPRISTINDVMEIFPILQDIVEGDDILVRMEAINSITYLLESITIILGTELSSSDKENSHSVIFEVSKDLLNFYIGISDSDILNYKVMACYITPIILKQRDLCNLDIIHVLDIYVNFSTSHAPMLRKYVCKVFPLLLNEIYISKKQELADKIFFPMLKSFCSDEQECVRLLSMDSIFSFLDWIYNGTLHLSECKISSYIEDLWPFIVNLSNDPNWRVRSVVSTPLIKVVNILLHVHNSNLNKNHMNSIQNLENISPNNRKTDDEEYTTSNIIDSTNNVEKDIKKMRNYLLPIITSLIMDMEGEVRTSTMKSIMESIGRAISIDKNTIKNNIDKLISDFLLFEILVPLINNNKIINDPAPSMRMMFTRLLTYIIQVTGLEEKTLSTDYLFSQSTNNIENSDINSRDKMLLNVFSLVLSELINDHDTQVRQSVILSLCNGIPYISNIDVILEKILIPYVGIIMSDSFWRVRYCCILLLTLIFYRILVEIYKEDLWNGDCLDMQILSNLVSDKSKKSSEEELFFNLYGGTPNYLLDMIYKGVTDNTSIIRQLTSIFTIPLLTFWLGKEWFKSTLWPYILQPMIQNEKVYSLRCIGLFSLNSILTGISIKSLSELQTVIHILAKLIFTVLPTNDMDQDYEIEYYSNSDSDQSDKQTALTMSRLYKHIPLISSTNLVLSYKLNYNHISSNDNQTNCLLDENDVELYNDITSIVIDKYSNDPVANVRIKSIQVLESMIKLYNSKDLVDILQNAKLNDMDLDVRKYCSEALIRLKV
ncbi:HEAT repeat family protein [Cryptosporidium muris RN66]|uniref:HEAT repeat family protein n=1 Tax=Cryptosporidium muris (strain RN66) TaxID=441375 RepID=B6AHX3_CRYMR|nr:HEAT repeat family protein [Cryptosporidium muris RN66]EEA07814.1 HEAT repeat family protein [Cryptosporidium muris RN66]|eukprot:XP_002142163.1 HEAT repeat family protein [Cryptosporidium muris RN66]